MGRKLIAGMSMCFLAVIAVHRLFAGEISLTVNKPALSVNSGDVFVLKVSLLQPTDYKLAVYDQNGKWVRTLSEKYTSDSHVVVPWNLKDSSGKTVNPGSYTIRLQLSETLSIDTSFGKNGVFTGINFISPWDIVKDNQGNIYLLDGGAAILYKFHPDGTPANDLAGKNTITAPTAPCWATVAVGPDGRIYLPLTHTTTHTISVYDPKSGAILYSIGGYEKITYPNWVGIIDHRLYATGDGGGRDACWDARKEGNTGVFWVIKSHDMGADINGSCGDTDGVNALYVASYWKNQLCKLVDTGETAKMPYLINGYFDPSLQKNVSLQDINGIAYDGQSGVFVVERASSKLIHFFDGGFGFDYVTSFGSRGEDAAKLEFTAPRSVAVSPDGKSLYLIEDGEPISKTDTTPGLARFIKYKIWYEAQKEIKVTVNP